MKSVQGDSGHAQVKMVADVYSHIIDEDRRLNAQRFEEAFYSGQGSTSPAAEQAVQTTAVPEKDVGGSGESDQELLLRLLQKPEIAAMLKTLVQAM